MSELDKAQLKKTQAEADKAAKETEKLAEEIKELKERKPYDRHNIIWWRDLIGILAVALSIVYGVINFIDQQRTKIKFQILAAYGKHVLPNLLNALTVSDSPGLLTALSLVAQKDPKAVSKPLIKRAESDIGSVLQNEKHKILSFKNYIKALGELGSLGDTEPTITTLKGFQEKLDCEQLKEQGNFTLNILDRRAICEEIANACEKIKPGACKK